MKEGRRKNEDEMRREREKEESVPIFGTRRRIAN